MQGSPLPALVMLAVIEWLLTHRHESAAFLVAAGFDAALVERIVRLTDGAEYKRRQYPPGTKIGVRAFGRDRRLPITNRWRERPDSNS